MKITDIIKFAIEKHCAQKYGSKPYQYHLYHVLETYRSIFGEPSESVTKIIFLHDILEDTDATIEELREVGLNGAEINCIKFLTKTEGVLREDYILALNNTTTARKVKIADSMSNLMHSIKDDKKRLINKYLSNLAMLTS